MALDGFELVLSRTAILDIFVLFFALAAFGCLVLDRDARRARWLRAWAWPRALVICLRTHRSRSAPCGRRSSEPFPERFRR